MNETTSKLEMPDWSRGVPLTAGPWTLGIYQPSPETAGFWEGVARHELLIKRCRSCGRLHHPRRIVCTACQEADFEWRPSSGRGTVYTFSEIHRAVVPEFKSAVPYTVGIVRLEEGVHLFSRLFSPSGVDIDDPVRVDFRVIESGQLLPVFLTLEPQ